MVQKYICLNLMLLLLCCLPAQAEETVIMKHLGEAVAKKKPNIELHQLKNEQGENVHLGIALFSDKHQQVLNQYLCRGCERMLLELLMLDNDAQRRQWMKERNVRLFIESTPFGNEGFASFSRVIPILKNIQSIKINEEANRYRLLIHGGAENTLLRMSFPKERELIYGTDKKEEDELQAQRLKNFSGQLSAPIIPDIDDLMGTSTPDVWHTMGQALYIDSLRTDGYYEVKNEGKTISPIYCSVHPKESVRNLLLGIVNRKELNVDVLHVQYGNRKDEWQTSWNNLLAALLSEEVMVPYAAAQYLPEQGKLTGILVLQNIAFGYINMLLLSIPVSQLDSQEPATLSALLYTNTPQHNILSLFEERSKPASNNNLKKFNHTITTK